MSLGPSHARFRFWHRLQTGRLSSSTQLSQWLCSSPMEKESLPHLTRRFRQVEQPLDRPPMFTMVVCGTLHAKTPMNANQKETWQA
jgi:hypothetical protein